MAAVAAVAAMVLLAAEAEMAAVAAVAVLAFAVAATLTGRTTSASVRSAEVDATRRRRRSLFLRRPVCPDSVTVAPSETEAAEPAKVLGAGTAEALEVLLAALLPATALLLLLVLLPLLLLLLVRWSRSQICYRRCC